MDLKEYQKVENYTYTEYCEYLKKKYGEVPYNYCTPQGKVIEQNYKKGLGIYHIDEDKSEHIMSVAEQYEDTPYTYHEASRLVYCGFLEEFLLWILLIEDRKLPKRIWVKSYTFLTASVIPALNDLISKIDNENHPEEILYFILLDRLFNQIDLEETSTLDFMCTSYLSRYGQWDNNLNNRVYQKIKDLWHSKQVEKENKSKTHKNLIMPCDASIWAPLVIVSTYTIIFVACLLCLFHLA